MLPILTPEESADLDRRSAERGITVDRLMENAGRAVARAVVGLLGGAYGRRAVVVCGKGNNGGDGLVAARHLERRGVATAVVLLDDPAALRGPSAANFRRYVERGGRWLSFDPDRLERELARADAAVDAMFGTGFRGSAEGAASTAIRLLNVSPATVVAVDVPSGVEGATGLVRGEAVRAELTVTFGAHKPGVVLHPGAAHAGVVEVADIGFPPDLVESDLALVEPRDVTGLLPERAPEGHKRSSGVVLVVAGSRAMTGAAVLAASAAYRAGAGLVTLAVPEGILPVVEGALAEATFLPLPETESGTLGEEAWDALADRLASVDAAAVGPGLTTDPQTSALVRLMVSEARTPLVVDADGLNAFAGRGPELASRRSEAVLTPHAGEFGRLTGLSAAEVLEDRVGHVRKAAAEFRCTVLLKGSRSLLAEPDGRVAVNPTGGPFLATAGTGDVLTGALGAFLARGLPAREAAILAAYVHGAAGQLAGAELGEGATASDVLRRLPLAIEALRRVPTG